VRSEQGGDTHEGNIRACGPVVRIPAAPRPRWARTDLSNHTSGWSRLAHSRYFPRPVQSDVSNVASESVRNRIADSTICRLRRLTPSPKCSSRTSAQRVRFSPARGVSERESSGPKEIWKTGHPPTRRALPVSFHWARCLRNCPCNAPVRAGMRASHSRGVREPASRRIAVSAASSSSGWRSRPSRR
jgi:hypothetical protein